MTTSLPPVQLKKTEVSVPAGLTKVATIPGGHERAGINIKPVGAALTDFKVRVRFFQDGPEHLIADAAGDYTSPSDPIILASGDLNLLGNNVDGFILLDMRGIHELTLYANSAGSPTVEIQGSLS